MRRKNPIINIAYHFLAETIIVFLIMVPLMHYRYDWIPYWSYLVIILGVCALFSAYAMKTNNYKWYIITAPILMVLLYLSGFPVLLSIVFPVLLTWRYIMLRREEGEVKREMIYINLILVLSVFSFIWTNDKELYVFAFLGLFILPIGNIWSHSHVLDKFLRKRVLRKLRVYAPVAVGIAAIGLLMLFNIRYLFLIIWDGLTGIITFVSGLLAMLVGVFIFDLDSTSEMEDQPVEPFAIINLAEDYGEKLRSDKTPLLDGYMSLIIWLIAMALVVVVIFVAIRYFRNKFLPVKYAKNHTKATYGHLNAKAQSPGKSIFSSLFGAPNNKVRRLIYQFENKAAKEHYERYSYETLDGWINRLGFDLDTDIYKKVRYGEKDVDDKDVETLQSQLKVIKDKMNG